MIVLMHGKAGGETRESFSKFYPVFVYGLDFDLFGAPDRAVEPGDR